MANIEILSIKEVREYAFTFCD